MIVPDSDTTDEDIEIEYLRQRVEELEADAEHWRDLLSHQKFNNNKAVGYAINRTKERMADKKQPKELEARVTGTKHGDENEI